MQESKYAKPVDDQEAAPDSNVGEVMAAEDGVFDPDGNSTETFSQKRHFGHLVDSLPDHSAAELPRDDELEEEEQIERSAGANQA